MSSKMSSERSGRILHGGAWFSISSGWRSTFRNTFRPGNSNPRCGFRLVAKAKTLPKLLRGGAWYTNSRNCRSTFRNTFRPGNSGSHYGFRLVAR